MTTLEEAIIETMPFSPQLIEWCKSHPDFSKALKIVYPEKFITLGAIVTSYSPDYLDDEVIGVYTYAYQMKTPIFKQDFVINKGTRHNEFILYTKHPLTSSSKYIKDIGEFYRTYGKNGSSYTNTHHLTLNELPAEIHSRGQQAINLANRVKKNGLGGINQNHIEKIYKQVKAIKNENKFIKIPLPKNNPRADNNKH